MTAADRARDRDGQQGSILLPVILLLLLLATAATAMTLQARTSLREAALRRDRLVLAATADGAVRATALALAAAAAARSAPTFPIDGTPQSCRLDRGRRLTVSVQDEGGLVDLNKGSPELLQAILHRAGLSDPDAASLVKAVVAHRADAPRQAAVRQPGLKRPDLSAPPEVRDFVLADEIGDLPGVGVNLFQRLRPLFTTSNHSAGIDPLVAAPAIRALIPTKELSTPQFEPMTTPSSHSDMTITATVTASTGQSFARRGLFRLDPDAGPSGRFAAWDAPVTDGTGPSVESAFCGRLAAVLAAF